MAAMQPLFNIEAIKGFHDKLEWELNEYLTSISAIKENKDSSYVQDNVRAFKEVRRRAFKVAAEAYLSRHAEEADVDALAEEYSHSDDLVNVLAILGDMRNNECFAETQKTVIDKLTTSVDECVSIPFVHPKSIQLGRVRAAIQTAVEVNTEPVEVEFVEDQDTGNYHEMIARGSKLVNIAINKRRRMSSLATKNEAIAASAAEYAEVSKSTQLFSDLIKRCSEALQDISDSDPCGLVQERTRHVQKVEALEGEFGRMREEAKQTLDTIIAHYEHFTDLTRKLSSVAKECNAAKSHANHVDDAVSHFQSLVDRESDLLLAKSQGASTSNYLAEVSSSFVRDFTTITQSHIKAHIKESDYRLEMAQASLHDAAGRRDVVQAMVGSVWCRVKSPGMVHP
eukprot:TRINITY_DN16206_c0_g1_i3.p1 TRINITY_DN16206_c0_g1~~TRINITY_DN16206_c0_g1_i3.p1  ORF type:complete len:397 (+),score=127.14 TRINITY_DN16206_c0_g1_i3:370-1560(+)